MFCLYDITVTVNTTFTATYSNVSDSVTVYLCQFADLKADTSNYIYDSRATVTSNNNVITVVGASGTYVFWCNKPGTSTSEFDFTGDFVVEFDVLPSDSITIQIYDNSASTYYTKTLSNLSAANTNCHIKIVKDGQIFKTFVDNVEKTGQQVNSNITNACRVGFRGATGTTFKFKNLRIY